MATQYWAYTQNIVLQKTYGVDFYNILTKKTFKMFSDWHPGTKALDMSLTDEGKRIGCEKSPHLLPKQKHICCLMTVTETD